MAIQNQKNYVEAFLNHQVAKSIYLLAKFILPL